MPNLPPVTFYQPTDPYHVYYDNLPIQSIGNRQDILNGTIDNITLTLEDAQGTVGSIAARLNKSLNPDGTIITQAIDNALHNIGDHTDGSYQGISYVRMLLDERNKLTNIQNDANYLEIDVETISTTVSFTNGIVTFGPSDTISFDVISSNVIRAHTVFPTTAVHNHFYDSTPVPANIVTPDYINYKTTSVPTVFITGSLRVYINGIRLSSSGSVYVPPASGPSGTWTLTTFTPNAAAGTFALNRAITSSDIIRIDFDTAFS